MFNGNFELNGETLKVVEEIGRHMPGGFFIYKAEKPEELLYANHAVYSLFLCDGPDDFKELTGNTFKGMLHPDDYEMIEKSINDQIDENDDNMDYVEYRIIRKDGSVRFVDDYGHFTNTKDYGGVYYVFISDITEKREFSRSVSSLLKNIPAMSFSKDAKTGKYLACNQAFADYANKETPKDVVGLTDHDIFDKETADHFVSDDKKAISMEEPYIFYEDVPDAVGKPLNLQTTKMKFLDENGRLCTLGMCVDVTEMTRIKSAEAEARIKQREAEEASRAKSQFLSNMSHEIRTPITAILGMNELIRRETKDEAILEYVKSIEKAGNSLLGIINDILDFSKIEAGRMELLFDEYNTADVIKDLSNLVKFRTDEKGLSFSAEADKDLPKRLLGDELRIKQIITNLLTNAAKYTEKGGVKLSLKLQKKEEGFAFIKVSVKDSGIGIKEEEMEKLFSAFDRLDVKKNRTIEGTGLGLSITKELLNLMGSSLLVNSKYGEGSEFSFVLKQRIVDEEGIGEIDLSEYRGADSEDEKRDSIRFTAEGKRLLLVDDTPLNLQVIKGLLKRTLVNTDTASSGEECIALFGENDYDMVFLDYRMPEMDGIETLNKLYEKYPKKAKETPIISLTASAVSGDKEMMIDAGFDDYLSKPVNIREMERMMEKYLSLSESSKALGNTSEKDYDPKDKEDDDALIKELSKIEGINVSSGVSFCGDAEDYLDALYVFNNSIKDKAKKIEDSYKNNDMENYVILVHSLKSTSRMVGAEEISALSLELEKAGKNNDASFIKEETLSLLKKYLDLHAALSGVLR